LRKTHLREVGLEPLEADLLLGETRPELLLGLLLLEDQLEVPARKVLLGRGRVDRGKEVELELVGVLRNALVGAADADGRQVGQVSRSTTL
jgi:hypothetical protein